MHVPSPIVLVSMLPPRLGLNLDLVLGMVTLIIG